MHTSWVMTVKLKKLKEQKKCVIRLQTFDGTESYPYGTNAFKVCESEMMTVRGLLSENYANFPLYDQIIL